MTLKSEDKNDGNQTKFCESKDCVRCNTYGDTLAKALTKVETLEDRDLIERIKNGINHKPFEVDEKQQPNVFCYYGLESTPVWKTEILGDCDILTNSSEIIKAEFYSLIKQGTQEGWKRNRTPQGSWDVFHLINQGLEVPENCNRCPKTMAVIWSLQSAMVENVFGNVMFSVLKSGTVITEHYGPTNIRLRCHLGKINTRAKTLCLEKRDQLFRIPLSQFFFTTFVPLKSQARIFFSGSTSFRISRIKGFFVVFFLFHWID